MTTTLDVARRIVGRRLKITQDEMAAILIGLVDAGIVNLCNDYVRHTCGDDVRAASSAWVTACRSITCISVDSRGLRDGQVRYDEPGSMHPLQHSEIIFAPDGIPDANPGSGSTLKYLRRHADRVLIVRQDTDDDAPEMGPEDFARAVTRHNVANLVTCECENGHKWQTPDPQRDLKCPTCGEYWV